MFHFLEADIREQKKYEMKTQISVDDTINDLRYEIRFENCVKDKNKFFIKWRHRYDLAKVSNAALVKLTDLIIKNDHVIVWCFSVSDLNMAKEAILLDSPQHDS